MAYHWAWAEYIQSAAILLISRYLPILSFDKSQTKKKRKTRTIARKTMTVTETTTATRSLSVTERNKVITRGGLRRTRQKQKEFAGGKIKP